MNTQLRKSLVLVVFLSLLSVSFANNYVHRTFDGEYFLGDIVEVEINLNAETKTDIAEYIPLSMQILNWTHTPNVKVEKRIIGDSQVIWFDVGEGETKITYQLLPKYVGVYEINSIITTPKGFEKEIFKFEVKRAFDISMFKWAIVLFSLIVFIKLVEMESVEER